MKPHILLSIFLLSLLAICQGDDITKCEAELMHSLPRVSLSFTPVSSNMGDYNSPISFSKQCPNKPATETYDTCTDELAGSAMEDPVGFIQSYVQSGSELDEGSMVHYFSSIMLWVIVGVFFGVFTVLVFLIYTCVKCCAMCKPPKEDKNYSCEQVICTYGLILSFIVTMVTLICLGHFRGNVGLTTCQTALSREPAIGVSKVVTSLVPPIKTVLVNAVGVSLVSGLKSINNTISTNVDLAQASKSFQCIGNIIEITQGETIEQLTSVVEGFQESIDDLPDLNATLDIVNAFSDSTQELVTIASTIGSDIAAIQAQLNTTEDAIVDMDSKVDGIRNLVSVTLLDTLTTVKSETEALISVINSVGEVNTAIDSVLDTFHNETSMGNLNTAISSTINAIDASDPVALSLSLQRMNDTIDEIEVELSSLVMDLGNTVVIINDDVAVNRLNDTLTDSLALVNGLDLTSLQETVADLQSGLSVSFDPAAQLQGVFGTLLRVTDEVDCALKLSALIEQIQTSVMVLPDDIADLENTIDDMNATINEAFDQIYSFEDELNGTLSLSDFSETTNSVNNTVNDLGSQLDDVKKNLLDAIVQVKETKDASNSTVIENLIVDLNKFRNDLTSSSMRPSESDLISLNNTKDNMEGVRTSLEAAQASFSGVTGTDEGPYTCTDDENVCYQKTSDPRPIPNGCDGDNGASGQFCGFPYELLVQVQGEIGTFQNTINSMDTDLENDILPGVNDAIDDVEGLDLSCCQSEISNVQEAKTFLDDTNENLLPNVDSLDNLSSNDATGSLEDAISSLDDVHVQLDDFHVEIQNVNSSIISSIPPEINDILDFVTDVIDYFTGEGLNSELANIDYDALSNLSNTSDTFFGDAVERLVTTVDSMLAAFNQTESPLSGVVEQSKQFTTILDIAAGYLKEVEEQDNDHAEAIQFLAKAYVAITNDSALHLYDETPDYDFPVVWGYLENEKINRYDESETRLCVTRKCIDNTIEMVNTQPLSNLLDMEIPVSRELAMFAPFLIAIIPLLFAVMMIWCSSCTTPFICLSCIMAPLMFLIAGGVLFPLAAMFPSDVCLSMDQVATTFVAQSHDYVCEQFGGEVNGEYCRLKVNVTGFVDEQIDVKLDTVLDSALFSCGIVAAEGDETFENIETFKSVIDKSVEEQFVALLNETLEASNMTFQKPLQEDITGLGTNLGGDLSTLFLDFTDALRCTQLTLLYHGIKDPICCECMNAVYYWVSSWYLMGFALLLCGFPSAVLTKTRIHKRAINTAVRHHSTNTSKQVAQSRYQQQPRQRRRSRLAGSWQHAKQRFGFGTSQQTHQHAFGGGMSVSAQQQFPVSSNNARSSQMI